MPDLTATSIAADLAAIMGALPGAVVSVTINGNAYIAFSGGPTAGNVEMEDGGLLPGDRLALMLPAAQLDSADIPTVHSTVVTVGGIAYRAESVNRDPFGAMYQIQLVNVSRYSPQ